MSKTRLLPLALAGLFALVPTRSPAASFQEDFSADPLPRGWKTFGEASLFHWNTTGQTLEVTWDSSKPNSYFHRPLGTILTRGDDFSLVFDLRLHDIAIGTTPGKPYTFQIAVGLVNWSDATRTNFFRGTGYDAPNVAEFNYFPDSGFGATVSPTIISSNIPSGFDQFATSFNVVELTTNDLFHVEMRYTASNSTLATIMTRNGQTFGPIGDATPEAAFTDFRVDRLAVCSYTDAGQVGDFPGSVLAHGVVDNLVVTTPPPPVSGLTGGFVGPVWQISFASQAHWLYTLERTADLETWSVASPTVSGDGGILVFQDVNQGGARFHRVRATKP